MSNLASIYGELGQYDKALALNEKTLAARTAKLGPDHPDTLKSMGNLAFTYGKLGQQDKALALEEKVLAARTAKLGADHPDTLVSMGNLWMTYMQLKKHAEAARLMERLVVVEVKRNGEKDGSTRTIMAHLYLLLDKQGLPKGFLASYAKDTQEDVLKRVFAMQQCPSKFQLGTMGLSTRPDAPGC